MPPAIHRYRVPSRAPSHAVVDLFVDECRDLARVVIPSAHVHLAVRYGSNIAGAVDVHAMGARQHAHRKHVRGAQRVVFARLPLGIHRKVLGASAMDLAGRVVALADLWGQRTADTLLHMLAGVGDAEAAASLLEAALSERSVSAGVSARQSLVQTMAERLEHDDVSAVALGLDMSPRHFRRLFLDEVGLSPKAYARLRRFDLALRAAKRDPGFSWSAIAADTGYYDQAHLILEFRSIAGATPSQLMRELGSHEIA